jgi:glucose/mannose-6-phosphate isomerase
MQNKNPLDKSDLRQVILDFPDQFEAGYKLAKNIKILGSFKSVCVSGMGGSSLPADILRIYLNNLFENKNIKKIGLYQNRTYSLPPESFDNCLNIFSSFSGGTEETIASLKQAIEKKLFSVGITNGGKLAEICRENNIPCVILPPVIQPRYATGYFFSSMLQILVNAGMIPDESIDIISEARKLKEELPSLEEKGESLAGKLSGKTPVIHSSDKHKGLAMVWKIKFNENAKTPAFWNYYPELNHNEMVGYTLPQAKFHILTLLDPKEHPQILKRIMITNKLLKKYDVETTVIEMPDKNIFNAIFHTLLLGDWISYYLALSYGQDPTPVDMVEDLKKMLK